MWTVLQGSGTLVSNALRQPWNFLGICQEYNRDALCLSTGHWMLNFHFFKQPSYCTSATLQHFVLPFCRGGLCYRANGSWTVTIFRLIKLHWCSVNLVLSILLLNRHSSWNFANHSIAKSCESDDASMIKTTWFGSLKNTVGFTHLQPTIILIFLCLFWFDWVHLLVQRLSL